MSRAWCPDLGSDLRELVTLLIGIPCSDRTPIPIVVPPWREHNEGVDYGMQRAYQFHQQGPGYPDYPDYPSGRNRRTDYGNPYDDPGQAPCSLT
jgi:hypothetical protein